MTSPRHLTYFVALGLFWGISPSLYRHWGVLGMPVTHVIVLTGLGVGVALGVICWLRGINWFGGIRLQLFGMGCAALMDLWLWASFVVLISALYLNNSGSAARPMST